MTTRTVLLLALGLSACSHGMSKVQDTDYARLGSGDTTQVQSMREFTSQARDDVARAKLKLSEARQEADLAKADEATADGALLRVKTETQRAEATREAVQIDRARQAREDAQLLRSAAEARRTYGKRLIAAREADVEEAEQRVKLGDAKVELAKLQALEQARVPALGGYDQGAFYEAVAKSQRRADEAKAEALKLDREAEAAQRAWQELARRIPAGTAR